MRLLLPALLACCCGMLAPRPVAAQSAYPRLVHVVGAIRTASLLSASSRVPSPPGTASPAVTFPDPRGVPLLLLTSSVGRHTLRVPLGGRWQLRASSTWLSSGPWTSVGLGLEF
jgi:hypothetical protein